MSDSIITVENLSKRYVIGHQAAKGDGLRHALERAFRSPLEWLRSRRQSRGATSEEFWALRDVNFEVKEGEVVGIIGRNGAGKSTLLKILSRITEPTHGQIRMKGRVSSLLEVGTGFHPELTGRENIFLNGAILGMSRLEIKRKFDEIVAFSEIEKFIDTPVKRYSSGMYVRLAFAVAAHLEPEILILDEVLAVGDTSFQKKCLGKMGEVAREGRTVLFVSHQMPAIQNLCSRCVMLDRGRLVRQGTTKEVLDLYLSNSKEPISRNLGERQDRVGKGEVRVNCLEICDAEGRPLREAVSGKDIALRMHYSVRDGITLKNCRASVAVLKDLVPFALFSTDLVDSTPLTLSSRGVIEIKVADLPLSGGTYSLASFIASDGTCQDSVENAETMDVVDGDFFGTGKLYPDGWQGKTVLIRHSWTQHPEQSPANGVNSRKSPAFCTGVENPVL